MVSKTVLHSISVNGPLRAAAAVALLSGAFGAAAASAERAGDAELQTVIVTGTRIHDGPAKVLGSTTVITASDIEASGDSNAIDLLRDTAGVHVVQPSGMGGVSRVFLRSGSQELAMVLLDGVRVNDPNDTRGATFDFSTLGLEDVERVEIVRGPQSAVYGSDALAGVVNFISREPPPQLGGTLHAEIGGENFYRGAAGFGAPLGDKAGFSLRAATVDDGDLAVVPEVDLEPVAPPLRGPEGVHLAARLPQRVEVAPRQGMAADLVVEEEDGDPRAGALDQGVA